MSESTTNNADLTHLKVQCHCGKNDFTVAFPTSSLPISTFICHCNICRHTTGNAAVYVAPIQGLLRANNGSYEAVDISAVDTLRAYKASGHATRYFCGTCAAHMFYAGVAGERRSYYVASGVLERVDGIIKPTSHIFMGDTLDGGSADHLIKCYDTTIARLQESFGSPDVALGWKSETIPNIKLADDISQRRLPFYCHCRKIQFAIRPLEKASSRPSDWWLRGHDQAGAVATVEKPIKYVAGYCFCTDCRKSSGQIFTSWTSVPEENIFTHPGPEERVAFKAGAPGVRLEGLGSYKSSEKLERFFCTTCGSRVADVEHGDIRRLGELGGERVGINFGNVDETAAGGARADLWVDWHEYIHFKESGMDQEIAKAFFAKC